ncbi:MAG: hypothetical protein JWR07_3366 [Nevskia sp.]|nr:hypothetical protein [Nevskia sp.]
MPSSTRPDNDEAAYAAVLEELKNGVRDEPLMAKAFAEAEGNDNKARALYMRWRSAKLIAVAVRERRQAFDEGARAAPVYPRPRKAARSWSSPRSSDFLLVLLALLLLFLFNRDVHHAVMSLLHALGLSSFLHPV